MLPLAFPRKKWRDTPKRSVRGTCPVIFSPSWRLTINPSACTAYSRYILDVGQSEDWLALQMALAPCLIGYGAIAKRLHSEKGTLREGNLFWKWIENYVAEDYTEAVRLGSGKK